LDLLVLGEAGLRKISPAMHGIAENLNREINPICFTTAEWHARTRPHLAGSPTSSPLSSATLQTRIPSFQWMGNSVSLTKPPHYSTLRKWLPVGENNLAVQGFKREIGNANTTMT
jgi:hypothetical protein